LKIDIVYIYNAPKIRWVTNPLGVFCLTD